MPNPPKPLELKRKLGNPGQHKLPKPIVALEPAVMPVAPVRTAADELAEKLWGHAGGWLAQSDALFLIPLLMDGWNELAELKAFIAENGRSYESVGPLGNKWLSRPEVIQKERLEKQITSWLSLLGLSPTDRTRLGVAEVRARSKLEELEERRAARSAATGRRRS